MNSRTLEKIQQAIILVNAGETLEVAAKLVGYKSISPLYSAVNYWGGKVVNGKIIIDLDNLNKKLEKRKQERYIEPITKAKTKKLKCNICGKTFKAELDKMGIPIKHRCKKCCDTIKRNYTSFRNLEYPVRILNY